MKEGLVPRPSTYGGLRLFVSSLSLSLSLFFSFFFFLIYDATEKRPDNQDHVAQIALATLSFLPAGLAVISATTMVRARHPTLATWSTDHEHW